MPRTQYAFPDKFLAVHAVISWIFAGSKQTLDNFQRFCQRGKLSYLVREALH